MKLSEEIRFFDEALPQLQDYLLSKELYWPLSASLPRLTLGGVLLSLEYIRAGDAARAEKFRLQLETVQVKWRTAWEKKAAREAQNRLRLWSAFLSDYRSAPEQYADSYRSEARGRAILELLLADLPGLLPERASLAELDAMLRSRLLPGEFLWEKEVQSVFDMERFWFLYGKLKP